MLAEFDIDSLRRFAAELDARPVPAPTGDRERVEAQVRHHADMLSEARSALAGWRDRVFRAHLPPDPRVDEVLRDLLGRQLQAAKSAAALGRRLTSWRNLSPDGLAALGRLHELLAEATYLLDHWRPATLSVSPGPRVRIPEAVAAKMMAKLREMSAVAASAGGPITTAVVRETDAELV